MTLEVGKGTKIKLSIESMVTLGTMIVALTTMWFTLKADIAEAKILPVPHVSVSITIMLWRSFWAIKFL